MTGYVFHCTPCGHAHAGECPPRKNPCTEVYGLPCLGSKWKVSMNSGRISDPRTFEVTAYLKNGEVLIRSEAGGEYQYLPRAWTPGGMVTWHFVPA